MKKTFLFCKILFLLFLMVLVLAGCWSARDIEKLDMLMGVGVDAAQDGSNHFSSNSEQPLTVTFQLAKVNGNQNENDSEKASLPYTNVEETGSSFLETAREIILTRQSIINGQHQRLIIISTEVAKSKNFREILDFFIREPEARMSCLVMVTDGTAKDVLDFMETDDIPSLHIFDLAEHIEKSNKLIEPKSLAKVNSFIEAKSSFLIQNVVLNNNEIKLSGAGAINGSTLTIAGLLDEEELVGITWLTASTDGGLVKVFDEKSKNTIIYELKSIKSKITPKIKNGQLSYHVKVKLDGVISEVMAETDKITKEENKKRLKKLIQEKVEEEIKNSLEKIQKELQVDVIGFHDYVRIKYPKFWTEHKDEWDTLFSQTPIDYEVDVNIANYGLGIRN